MLVVIGSFAAAAALLYAAWPDGEHDSESTETGEVVADVDGEYHGQEGQAMNSKKPGFGQNSRHLPALSRCRGSIWQAS